LPGLNGGGAAAAVHPTLQTDRQTDDRETDGHNTVAQA